MFQISLSQQPQSLHQGIHWRRLLLLEWLFDAVHDAGGHTSKCVRRKRPGYGLCIVCKLIESAVSSDNQTGPILGPVKLSCIYLNRERPTQHNCCATYVNLFDKLSRFPIVETDELRTTDSQEGAYLIRATFEEFH